MLHALILLAEGAPPQSGAPSWYIMPLLLGFLVLYFVFMRPGRGDAERKALLSTLKKNDKVITIGGIHGTVVSVAEKEDEMIIRVEDNVKLKMSKSAVARNLTNEEAFKAAQAKGKTATTATADASAAKDAVTTPPKT